LVISTALLLVVTVLAVAAALTHPAAHRVTAPALPRETLLGSCVALRQLRGRPALINSWASWCGPCQREAAELERFASEPRAPATLVGVNANDQRADALAFLRRYGWTFANVRDPKGVTAGRYVIAGFPTTIVVDAQGYVVGQLRGPQTRASLERAARSAATRGQ
jgi:thiol-disulfide isomerase/thioredoxin